jgi:hypothetical protein
MWKRRTGMRGRKIKSDVSPAETTTVICRRMHIQIIRRHQSMAPSIICDGENVKSSHALAAPVSAETASSGVEKIRNKLVVRVTSKSFCTRALIPLRIIFRPAFLRVT